MTERLVKRLPLATVAYCVLSLILLLNYAAHAFRNDWVYDFWIHAAIVRELTHNPFSPSNPFFSGYSISIPYWPYCYVVSLLALLTKTSPHVALSIMGGLNLCFFLATFFLFVSRYFNNPQVPFFSLFAALFFWGQNPWEYSCFINWKVIFHNCSYASMFAEALVFFALYNWLDYLDGSTNRSVMTSLCALLIVLLCHPITFLLGIVGAICLTIERRAGSQTWGVLVAGFLIVSGVGCVWPFFPLLRLFVQGEYISDPGTQELFTDVFQKAWPALFGIIPLVIVSWRKRIGALFWSLLIFTIIYFYGGLSRHWNFGRVEAYIILLLQVYLGFGFYILFARFSRFAQQLTLATMIISSVAVFGIGSWALEGGKNEFSLFDRYKSFSSLIQGGIVLTSAANGLYLPSFGAKVIILAYPSLFTGDYETRRADVANVLATGDSLRLNEVIIKYHASMLLLNEDSSSDAAAMRMAKNLRLSVLQRGQGMVLFSLKEVRPEDQKVSSEKISLRG